MKRILIAILALGIALTSASAKNTNKNEAEYLYRNTTYTLDADGSQSARTSFALKIFTHTAMNRTYGETRIMYNPAYQKVVINSAYVVQGDGTRIDAPENSIVGFLPGEAAKSAFYNNIRTVCVVHAGLELGCTIYLDYTVESSPDYLPELDVFQVIQQSSPVDAMNITFNVPSGRKLRYKLHDAGIDYGVSDVTDGDVKTVKFTMADVPASSKDPGTSILCGDIPFISACTWESNAALTGYLASQLQVVSPGDSTVFAGSVPGKLGTASEIRDYCGDNIAYLPLPLSAAAFRCRSAEDVRQSAIATEFERANLENVMMTLRGIPGTVGASFGFNAADCDVLTLGAIDHIFAGQPEGCRLEPAVCLSGSGFEKAAAPVRLSFKVTVTVTRDSVLCEGLGAGKLVKTAGTPIVVLPGSDKGLAKHNGYAHMPVTRTGSLLLPYRSVDESYEYEITVKFPKMPVTFSTSPIDIVNGVGSVSQRIITTGEGFRVTRSLHIDKQIITPEEFPDFHALVAEWYQMFN